MAPMKRWLFLLLLGGCLKPTPDSGRIVCGAGDSCLDGYYCEPASHTCWKNGESPSPADMTVPVTNKAVGESCGSDAECANNQCVDGYCCAVAASACTGCRTCSVAGSLGQCTNVPTGSDPHGMCSAVICANGCNGAGACAPADTTTVCSATSTCSNTDAYSQATGANVTGTFCNGVTTGDCTGMSGTFACPGHLICADGAHCLTGCTNDGQCFQGFYCNAGKCESTKALGAFCSRNAECAPGFCVGSQCVTCRTTRDCTGFKIGAVCTASHDCSSCSVDQDCISGGKSAKCVDNGAAGKSCECMLTSECTNNNNNSCNFNGCTCTTSSPFLTCDGNSACIAQACKLVAGATCYRSVDCASGTCTSGMCN
jgi:hypothetical protein